jgi:hypothetical protein
VKDADRFKLFKRTPSGVRQCVGRIPTSPTSLSPRVPHEVAVPRWPGANSSFTHAAAHVATRDPAFAMGNVYFHAPLGAIQRERHLPTFIEAHTTRAQTMPMFEPNRSQGTKTPGPTVCCGTDWIHSMCARDSVLPTKEERSALHTR